VLRLQRAAGLSSKVGVVKIQRRSAMMDAPMGRQPFIDIKARLWLLALVAFDARPRVTSTGDNIGEDAEILRSQRVDRGQNILCANQPGAADF